jgi:subtilisin family serine protease
VAILGSLLAAAPSAQAAYAPTIAVIDTGVNPNHQELSGQIGAWWDFSADAGNHLPGNQTWDNSHVPFDPIGHGTVTASMAAGKNLAQPTKSYAPGTRLAIAKVFSSDGLSTGSIADAISWATHTVHADVITMSIGSMVPLPSVVSADVFAALADARTSGVLVTVSNGNGYGNAGLLTGDPGEANNFGGSPHVLSVGASGIDGFFVSTDPEVASDYNVTGASSTNNSGYVSMSGTSFATPLVGGFAAMLIKSAREAGQDASPNHIETLIKYSAFDTIVPPTFEGYGVFDDLLHPNQLADAQAHAAAGTLPARPAVDDSGIYVDTLAGLLRQLLGGLLCLC